MWKALPVLGSLLICSLSSTSGRAQSWSFQAAGEPIEIAPSSFGNKSIRMVLNASEEPVVAFGSSGHLYVTRWDSETAAFSAPVEIDPASNVFMSDAEGPRMKAQGDYLIITYQLSGEWANGARSVHSNDGGATWSDPVAMVSGATEDHFMPCVGIDGQGNPFAGVKVGNNPATIFEGILKSNDGGNTWSEAYNASEMADGNAVCECCPSEPFWSNGRYYDLVRNNNGNIRDFWLLSSADGQNWDGALDIDPLDWMINSCPESGASYAGPVNGSHWYAAFMSAAGPSGQSRIHVSTLDLSANDGAGTWLSTSPVTVGQFDNATQNAPVMAHWESATGDMVLTAMTWEQNSSGYDVQLAISSDGNFTDIAQNITEAWSGQHRKPVVQFSTGEAGEPVLHLVWQQSSSGTVNYLKGTLSPVSIVVCFAPPTPQWFTTPHGIQVQLPEHWFGGTWHIWDITGRLIKSGIYPLSGDLFVSNEGLPTHAIFSVELPDGTRWAEQIITQSGLN